MKAVKLKLALSIAPGDFVLCPGPLTFGGEYPGIFLEVHRNDREANGRMMLVFEDGDTTRGVEVLADDRLMVIDR